MVLIYNYVSFTLSLILFIIFGICLIQGYILTQKLHGGRFTSVLPPLMSGIAILFSIQLLTLIMLFIPLGNEPLVNISLTIQLMYTVAGLLLVQAMYQLYQLGFATSGFFGGK